HVSRLLRCCSFGSSGNQRTRTLAVPPHRGGHYCRIVDNSAQGMTGRREGGAVAVLTEETLTDAERDAVQSVPDGLFIGGRWRPAAATMAVIDPATGRQLRTVADAT